MTQGGALSSLLTPYALFSFGAVLALTHLNAQYSLCHQILNGITFWLPPSDEDIDRLPRPQELDQNTDESNNLKQRKNAKKKSNPAPASAAAPAGQLPIKLALIKNPYMQHGYLYNSFNQLVYISAISFANLLFAECWACASGIPANDIAFLVSVVAICYTWLCLIQTIFVSGNPVTRSIVASVVSIANAIACYCLLAFGNDYFEFQKSITQGLAAFVPEIKEIFSKPNDFNLPEIQSLPEHSEFLLKLFLCVLGSLYSFATFFPVVRQVRCHFLLVDEPKKKSVTTVDNMKQQLWKLVSYVNLLSPLLVSLLWLPMLWEDLDETNASKLFPTNMHMRMRLFVVFVFFVLRCSISRSYVQGYSFSSLQKVYGRMGVLNFETGKIIQALLRGCFLQLPVVAMEIFGPVIIQLTLALLLKRKGEFNLGVCSVLLGDSKHSVAASTATFTNNSLIPVLLNFSIFWSNFTQAVNHVLAIVAIRYIEWTD